MKAVAEAVDESEEIYNGYLEESDDGNEDTIDISPDKLDTLDGITNAIDALIDIVGDEVVVSYGDNQWALFALKEHLEDLEKELSSSYSVDKDAIYSLNPDGDGVLVPVVAVLTE